MVQQVKPDINDVWASDGDTGTPPLTFDIKQGWLAEKPPFQEMNWLQNRFNEFIKHMNEFGIAEWDTTTNYANNALVIHNGAHYTSTNDDNAGNVPTVSNWNTVDFQPALPPGSIIDWQGDYDNPPSGWAICDGTNGTPNLNGLFTRAADSATGSGSIGNPGGSIEKTTTPDGSHDHGGTTNEAGLHNHSANIDPRTLAESQMPSHGHNIPINFKAGESANVIAEPGTNALDGPGNYITEAKGGSGSHDHGFQIGNEGTHDHIIPPEGFHTHGIQNALPPFYTLVKIMKL